MRVNKFCGFIYNKQILSNQGSLSEKIFSKLRKGLLKKVDPFVYVVFSDGNKMYMPFSHELPMYKKYNPKFMSNLRSFAGAVKSKNGNLNCLDIGANIGDSVIEIGIKDANYLLVEGNKKYSKFIKMNLQNKGYKYDVIETYLGSENKNTSCKLVEKTGTGRLEFGEEGVEKEFKIRTVDELILKKGFQPNFIKLGADGFEIKILKGTKYVLEHYHPALFLQWVPTQLRKAFDDPMEIFDCLEECGVYTDLNIYDNFGHFLMNIGISDRKKLEQLCSYAESEGGKIKYYYIAVEKIERKA